MFHGVVIWMLCLMLSLSYMLIIFSAVQSALVPYLNLLGVLLSVSLDECVLLSTSKSVRKAMKLWDISGGGNFWKVQLDVRDLGGHLDFTLRARAGTLSKRVGAAIVGVAAVGALPLWFQVKLGLVRGEYLPAGLHAAEVSYVSSSSTSASRAAIVCEGSVVL